MVGSVQEEDICFQKQCSLSGWLLGMLEEQASAYPVGCPAQHAPDQCHLGERPNGTLI